MVHKLKNWMLTKIGGLKGKLLEQAEHNRDEITSTMPQWDDFAPTKPYQLIRREQGYLRINSSVVLLRPGLLVGRGESCHLKLADPNASRVHASFAQVDHGWLVQDNSSKNGTLLNGKPITSALLKKGDRIQIGQTLLVYEER